MLGNIPPLHLMSWWYDAELSTGKPLPPPWFSSVVIITVSVVLMDGFSNK
jgi:hypothetical protein